MTEKANSVSTDLLFQQSPFTKEEQVRLLYMQAPIANSFVMLVAIFYYFLLQSRIDSKVLLMWTIALLLASSYRMFLWYTRKHKPESRTAGSWLRSYLVGCGLVGSAWSMIYPFLYETSDQVVFIALSMLAFSVISSAVPILAVYLPAFILYIYPQGLVLFVTFLRFDNYASYWLAFAVCLYLIMMTLFARNTNHSMLRSFRLQEQNGLLIEGLNREISQREMSIAQRTLELKEKNENLSTEIKVREDTEKRLHQANNDLDATLQAIPDPMFELDRNGEYVAIWARDTDLLASQKEDIIGHTVKEMLPPDSALQVMAAIQEAAETGSSDGKVIKVPLEDGMHWFEISTSRKQCSGSSSHFLMVCRDVTDKHKMENELLKARKLESVGVLAGGIAHDFNNILSAIMGNIELASFRVTQDARATALLTDAQNATKKATKLTQQLLTFSKGGDPVKELTDLTGLIRDSVDFVLNGSQVSCEYDFPDDLWMVNVDSGQFIQVIQNLVLNANFAMPDGGSIRISCENVEDTTLESPLKRYEQGGVRITIQDTGAGIPQEIINNIFDPYFTTKKEGSGLGLAICHAIINKHEGNIVVHSSPNEGTTFTIYLPAVPGQDIKVAKQQKTKTAVKTARIMFMDDEEMIRVLAKAQLSALGHEAILVEDGEEAINTYRNLQDSGTPVDLVIMDLTIPGGVGGQEAARRLLQLVPEAKIIVASGYSTDPVMAHFSDYGFLAAVSKPFDLAELRKGIDTVLS